MRIVFESISYLTVAVLPTPVEFWVETLRHLPHNEDAVEDGATYLELYPVGCCVYARKCDSRHKLSFRSLRADNDTVLRLFFHL